MPYPAGSLTPTGSEGPDPPEDRLKDVHCGSSVAGGSWTEPRCLSAASGREHTGDSDEERVAAVTSARTPLSKEARRVSKRTIRPHVGQVQKLARLTILGQAAVAKHHRQGGLETTHAQFSPSWRTESRIRVPAWPGSVTQWPTPVHSVTQEVHSPAYTQTKRPRCHSGASHSRQRCQSPSVHRPVKDHTRRGCSHSGRPLLRERLTDTRQNGRSLEK